MWNGVFKDRKPEIEKTDFVLVGKPMINSPTVFILGAGASAPYGLPLGRPLLIRISKKLAEDQRFIKDIRGTQLPIDRYLIEDFNENLINSGQPSVDAFLEHRPEYLKIGKVSIARALIPLENEGLVEHANNNKNNWYGYLYNQMNAPFEDLDKNKVSFITFNYDRSLEYYLLQTTIFRYGVSEKEAVEKLKKIPIIHLHGQLGVLTGFQNENEYYRDYNTKITPSNIQRCADNIKIIHEADDTTPEFEKAHELIWEAKVRCILGFGYNENNIKKLFLPVLDKAKKEVKPVMFLGSAFGIAGGERKKIEATFRFNSQTDKITLGDDNHLASDFIRQNEVFLPLPPQ